MTLEYKDILASVQQQLEKIAGTGTQLSEDSDLVEELGLDSFKVLDLLLEIEDEFDISVPMNVLADVRTVRDLAEKIQELAGAKQA